MYKFRKCTFLWSVIFIAFLDAIIKDAGGLIGKMANFRWQSRNKYFKWLKSESVHSNIYTFLTTIFEANDNTVFFFQLIDMRPWR